MRKKFVLALVVLSFVCVVAIAFAGKMPDSNNPAPFNPVAPVKIYRGYIVADEKVYFVGEYKGRLYLFGSYAYNPVGKPGALHEPIDVTGNIDFVDYDTVIGYYYDGEVHLTDYCDPSLFEVVGVNATFC